MEENEAVEIVLDLNVKDAGETLESFMKGMESLQDLAQNIGAELRKAFAPLQASLQKTVSGIYTMTDALTATSSAMQSLMEQMANEQVADQWMSGISTAIDSLALSIDVAKIIKAMGSIGSVISKIGSVCSAAVGWITGTLFPAITTALSGIAAALGISVGWVVAIIAAVVAAIAAMVIYWDEIKIFFTDTLPQLWSQFTQWLGNVGTATAEAFGNAVSALSSFLSDCWNGITAFLCGMGDWMRTNVVQPIIDTFTSVAQWLAQMFDSIQQTVTKAFYNIGIIACGCQENIKDAWGMAVAWFKENIIAPICNVFSTLWNTVSIAAVSAWESIKEAFGKAWTWFKDTVVDPLVNGFKGAVNGVIGFINGLIAGVVKGINSIVQMLNSLKFTVPDWVPGLGGQTLGFHLKTVTTPQIPYLAKGAVLPANKPFLAMVGDQRHGTNIEAPLATIQEAVAMTMEDFAAGNMAGHQATVAVLTQILEAVLGIHISDTEIGRAAERYQSKIAIARGNVW